MLLFYLYWWKILNYTSEKIHSCKIYFKNRMCFRGNFLLSLVYFYKRNILIKLKSICFLHKISKISTLYIRGLQPFVLKFQICKFLKFRWPPLSPINSMCKKIMYTRVGLYICICFFIGAVEL